MSDTICNPNRCHWLVPNQNVNSDGFECSRLCRQALGPRPCGSLDEELSDWIPSISSLHNGATLCKGG